MKRINREKVSYSHHILFDSFGKITKQTNKQTIADIMTKSTQLIRTVSEFEVDRSSIKNKINNNNEQKNGF